MKHFLIFISLLCVLSFSYGNISQNDPPYNLQNTNITYEGATFSWSNNEEAAYWILSYNVSQSNLINELVLSDTTTQIFDLISGTTYNWKVKMVDIYEDTTSWSNIMTLQIPNMPSLCSGIASLNINSMTSQGIIVQWVTEDTNQYNWEVVLGELGSNPSLEGYRVNTQNYFCLIPNNVLLINNWYQIAVRNICEYENSAWSYINVRYIYGQYYELPLQQTFEESYLNSNFGFINGQINPFVLGNSFNATPDGENSIYVSTTAGQTNEYYPNASAISYAYMDVMIPSYAVNFYVDFKWKCLGEAQYDGLKVYLLSENSVLDVNLLPEESYNISQSLYNNEGASWQDAHIEIPAQWVGEVRKLVFAWVNNDTLGGEGGAIIDDIYVTARYCAPPQTPTHSNLTNSSATLSWAFAEGQESFNIQYRRITDIQWTTINSVSSNYEIENLQENTTYIYRVQADCLDEESFFSIIDTFTTLIRCIPPENISTIDYNNNYAKLYWEDNNVASVNKWIFSWGIYDGENTIYNSETIEINTKELYNLTPNTTYSIKIKAISSQNDTSIYSNEYLFTTLCDNITEYPYFDLTNSILWDNNNGYEIPNPCWHNIGDTLLSPVFDLTNMGYPILEFKYRYKDSVISFAQCKLMMVDEQGSYYPLQTLNQQEELTTFSLEIPQMANENYFRIALILPHSEISKATFELKDFVLEQVCKSPQDISALDITQNSVKLIWDGYSNNTQWSISLIDTLNNFLQDFNSENPYLILDNLNPNTTYKVIIKASCNETISGEETQMFFTTMQQSTCQKPTNFIVVNQGSDVQGGIVLCSWANLNSEASSWELQYKEEDAYDWTSIVVLLTPQMTIRNLEDKEYVFRVRTICSIGDTSLWSETISISLSLDEKIYEQLNQIKIYPNPSKGVVNIENEGKFIGEIEVINQKGQIIQTYKKLPSQIEINENGIYYLILRNEKTSSYKKIIINK
ncbi:MAG: fibronectin type III domain-containing protein [Bacteroidales bacterium]|jgi:hypothetical protein|nr:fibronectin type III domain-containing protein [Bacteroidales bacterium]